MDLTLKYGCNPHQAPSRIILPDPSPLQVLNGSPGYINILDAFGAWQLARELRQSTGLPAAASFKHTSPAGAAIARPLTDEFRKSQYLPKRDYSPVTLAYIRARGGDRMCSFGDVAAVSDTVDESLARVLRREATDLIIAPGYEPEALEILKQKKGGTYLVLQMDPDFAPPELEQREIFGFTLEQRRNHMLFERDHFRNPVTEKTDLPDSAVETLMVATIALKYTQSNSVCVAYDGQIIGMGAGQQSRIHCTRLACDKADKWFLQQHPKTLGLPFKQDLKRVEKVNVVDQYLLWDQLADHEVGVMLQSLTECPEPVRADERCTWGAEFGEICLSSDALIPFRDNIDRASRTNIRYIAQTGQSNRDSDVTQAANEYGMVMVHTGIRCFLH